MLATQHRLPDGTMTRSERRYIKAWRDFTAPLCKALGGKLHSFDPGFNIVIPGRTSLVSFDADVARLLNAALEPKNLRPLGALPDGGALIMMWPPVPCGCGRAASMLVNRDGKTRCVDCDTKYLSTGTTPAERIARS